MKELGISGELAKMSRGHKAVVTSPLGARVYCEMLDVAIHNNVEFKQSAIAYYGFENPQLKSLYGGEWELKGFRHLPNGSVLMNEERVYLSYLGNLMCAEHRRLEDTDFILLRESKRVPNNDTIIFTDSPNIELNNYNIRDVKVIQNIDRLDRLGLVYFSTNECALQYYALRDSMLRTNRYY